MTKATQAKSRKNHHTYITNTSPQTLHDNHTDNTTHVITIAHNHKHHHDTHIPSQLVHCTHTPSLTHISTSTHTGSHPPHTNSHHTSLFQQPHPLSRSVLPPRALRTHSRYSGLSRPPKRPRPVTRAPGCRPDGSRPFPIPSCKDAAASPAGNVRMRIQHAVSGRLGDGDPQEGLGEAPATLNHPSAPASQRTFQSTTVPRRPCGSTRLPAKMFCFLRNGTGAPGPHRRFSRSTPSFPASQL